MFNRFNSEANKIKDPSIEIKQALIKMKKKNRDEGRKTLENISKGNFVSTGSDSKDLEVFAEASYQIALDDLKMSKDNTFIAKNLK